MTKTALVSPLEPGEESAPFEDRRRPGRMAKNIGHAIRDGQ
jgi:hypothetical protein